MDGPQRDRPAGQGGGLDGAADAGQQPLRGVGRARVVHERRVADPGRGVGRAHPRDRPERLHAALRRADRAGRPLGGAARGRLARGRLPDPHPGGGVRLRAGSAAVLADHGHQRRRAAVGPRLARDLPRGQDVRGRLRRLLRVRRADPLRRPGGRRVPAGHDRAVQRRAARRALARDRVHGAPADRGSHRRAHGVLAGAADQPAAGHLRAAPRRAALRVPRGVHRAPDRGHRARDDGLHAASRPDRAVGSAGRRARGPIVRRRTDGAGRHRAAGGRRGGCRGRGIARDGRGNASPSRPPRASRPPPARKRPPGTHPGAPSAALHATPGSEVCPKCGTELGDADETASATASAPQ